MPLTDTDCELAPLFYPLLVNLAQRDKTLTFGEFLTSAQAAHPNNVVLGRAVPLNVARRLEVVRQFTRPRGYPDISCLVVNARTREPGEAWDGNYELERERIRSFAWESIEEEFYLEVERQQRNSRPLVRRNREDAKQLMNAYHKANRLVYGPEIIKRRDALIDLLMKGVDVEDVFEIVAHDLRRGD
ncbi:hypothetical protein ABVV53_08675 [Novosphingobium sp. RD2P27]|uniref:Uncharacterized protein n=1 Tax=Novosphingobium kalidii TaxID=3230299 RepID=A0ABV2D100_9SPHN